MNQTIADKIHPFLTEDYYLCKKTFESTLKSPYVLDFQLQEKLKTLQLLIENPENSINPQEMPTKFEHLINLDKISCIRLYIDTITCLFPRKNATVNNYIRKGIIYLKRQGGLRNWKKQLITMNVQEKNLTLGTYCSSEFDKVLSLNKIHIEWVGFKKGKHCFKLQNLASRNPVNQLLIGHQQFNCVREWYELIIDVQNKMEENFFTHHNFTTFNEMEKSLSDNELEKSQESSSQQDQENKNLPFTTNTQFLKGGNHGEFEGDSFLHLDEVSTNLRTEEQIKELAIPEIFHECLKNFSLEALLEEDDYDLICIKDSLRILKHNSKNTLFKAFFQIDYPLKTVCEDIMEIKNSKQWNKVIEEIKVLNVITEVEESYFINEKHRAFGKMYWQRDFCYLQSFIKHQNFLINLKKSINYSKNNKNYTRGNIDYFVEVFLQHPKSSDFTLGILNIDLNNAGYFLKTQQNIEMTLKYLKQYRNLNSYMAHKNFVRSITKNISLYKIPIETSYKPKVLPISKQNSLKLNILNNEPPQILFTSDNSEGGVILTPTLQTINEEEKADSDDKNKAPLTKDLLEIPFNKKELNTIYEKSEESKSYDFSTDKDKILEKDIEEILIKDTLLSYKEISPKNSKFPRIDRSDYVKMLEIVASNEHSIRSICKHYITHPIRTKEKFQSIYPEHYVFNKDWVKMKDGGLSYHNKKNIDNQKKVAGYLLKKIGKNLLSGKSIMNISMPIDIFDTTSFLERIAYSFTNIPLFLEKAAKTTDIIQQMNYVCAAMISTLHMALDQIKPFNPILGETFQGWIKGSPIYLEQISHHPPISAFQLYGNGYVLQGNFELVAELHANSLTGKQLGIYEVLLKNQNRRFYFTIPTCEIRGGFTFGTRTVTYEGISIVYNKEQSLIMEINFNPDRKGFIQNLFTKSATPCDYFNGATYKVNDDCMKRLLKIKPIAKFMNYGVNKKTEIVEEIGKISGIWHEFLMIDDKKYWDIKEHVAYELEYEVDPLPSDSVYREDSNVWKSGNVENGQLAKEKLEEIQRADRKWRAKLGPKKSHH